MLEIKGYITNLGKYNEGDLIGEWVTFPISDDELEEVFERIGINEEYEEFFFTDWDCEFDNNFGEYENIERINEIAESLQDWDDKTFESACEIWSVNEILENDYYDYTLYGDVHTDYDLGFYYVHEAGIYDLDKMGTLANYFDYEAFGRDIRFETDGGHTSNGWIEYNG